VATSFPGVRELGSRRASRLQSRTCFPTLSHRSTLSPCAPLTCPVPCPHKHILLTALTPVTAALAAMTALLAQVVQWRAALGHLYLLRLTQELQCLQWLSRLAVTR
jgi:hypothetical protein